MPKTSASKPRFFAQPSEFRAWLEANHESSSELLVGFYKRDSGKPSMTWPESVDEALCFGWIDGVRRSLGADSYTIRFTPRKPSSIWSAVNVAKVAALVKARKMRPAGERAFAARKPEKTGVYSFERAQAAQLTAAEEAQLQAHRKAAAFFAGQAPWYRRTAIHWVVSAKRAETRERRLKQLIMDSAAGRRIGLVAQPTQSKARGSPKPRARRRSPIS